MSHERGCGEESYFWGRGRGAGKEGGGGVVVDHFWCRGFVVYSGIGSCGVVS